MSTLDDAREGMDLSVRPQDDLFGHVNGQWYQTTEIPAQLLIKGAVISGFVYGKGKVVQPGASVQLSPVEPNGEGHRTVRADGTGRFVIENARPGTYRLSATRPSSGSSNPFEAIADIRQSEVEISIEDGGRHEFDLHVEN